MRGGVANADMHAAMSGLTAFGGVAVSVMLLSSVLENRSAW